MLSAAFLLAVDLILPHPKRPQNMISLERTYYVYSYKVQLVYNYRTHASTIGSVTIFYTKLNFQIIFSGVCVDKEYLKASRSAKRTPNCLYMDEVDARLRRFFARPWLFKDEKKHPCERKNHYLYCSNAHENLHTSVGLDCSINCFTNTAFDSDRKQGATAIKITDFAPNLWRTSYKYVFE